eukprot:jgi/Botrbrau1/8997/Bobra.0148s0100.1
MENGAPRISNPSTKKKNPEYWKFRAKTSGLTEGELLKTLKKFELLETKRVENVMKSVDRRKFLPEVGANLVYRDAPFYIEDGQRISAPGVHAQMLELISPFLPDKGCALDIGTGTGYVTACLRELVGRNGRVVGVECLNSMADRTRGALEEWMEGVLEDGTIQLFTGNALEGYPIIDCIDVYDTLRTGCTEGLQMILERWGPYDAIHVGALATTDASSTFVKLLKPGGRLVTPESDPERRKIIFDNAYHPEQVLKTYTLQKDGTIREEVHDVVKFATAPLIEPSKKL